MRIPRIHQAQALTRGATITLDDKAAHHVARVLRLKPGHELKLFNGTGVEFDAQITAIDKHHVSVTIGEAIRGIKESELAIHLGQAISRSAKMDFALQKAVELGVSEFTPLISEHCAINTSEKVLEKRIAHWQAIIINACEQCGRTRLPTLHPPCSPQDWFERNSAELSLVLDPRATTNLLSITQHPKSILLLIGPEGGLSHDEIKLAHDHKAIGITLGPRILRTETAALSAISILQARWGDLK